MIIEMLSKTDKKKFKNIILVFCSIFLCHDFMKLIYEIKIVNTPVKYYTVKFFLNYSTKRIISN